MESRRMIAFSLVFAVALSLPGCGLGERDEELRLRQEAPATETEPQGAPAQLAREQPGSGTVPSSARPGMKVLSTALPTGEKASSVIHVEKSTPEEVVVGEAFDYKLKLTNLTDATLKDVVLTAMVPQEFKVAGTGPQATLAGRTVKWNVGELGPRASRAFVVRGQATSTGSLVCCSEVSFRNPKFCLVVKAVQPALKITKTGPAEAIVCDVIPYRIVVSNPGSGSAANVTLTDVLPAGMKTVDGKSAAAVAIGTLRAGEAREVTIRVKASKPGKYVTKATAQGAGGLTAASQAVTTVVRVPALVVTKTGPKMRFVGRPASYTIKVTNQGDAPARNTVLTDTLPPGAQLVGASPGGKVAGGKVAGGKVTWNLGTLPPGAAKEVTVILKPTQQGVLRNLATAKAYCAQASGQASTVVKGIPAILLECVDLADPIEVGAQETYVITVTNQGSADGTNIVVACTVPPEEQFVSASGPTKEAVRRGQVTFAPLKSLAPKAKATYRVVVKGAKPGDVRFKVSLTSDQMTSPAGETESTHIYE